MDLAVLFYLNGKSCKKNMKGNIIQGQGKAQFVLLHCVFDMNAFSFSQEQAEVTWASLKAQMALNPNCSTTS